MDNKQLASRIKYLCEIQSTSITHMLLSCHLRRSLIYDLEKRDISISTDALDAIADYFQCPADYLLGRGIFQYWDKIIEHNSLIFSYLHYQFGEAFTQKLLTLSETDLMRWFNAFIQEVKINGENIDIIFSLTQ